MYDVQKDNQPPKAMLIAVHYPHQAEHDVQDSLAELQQLTKTLGAEVVGIRICRLDRPHANLLLGKGKVEELATQLTDVQLVIFDTTLAPIQERNLEKAFGVHVIDRTRVILDIFALHAKTREGTLQVQLAKLEYELPRLRHLWTHLERQKGGIGLMGGPGEKQIEVDRRGIAEKIRRTRNDLEEVKQRREQLRYSRRRQGWALVSIVGYTNAGKSTLLNHLTGAKVAAENQLFVTLDPTTRQLQLPNNQGVLLTDTVGFINNLPHSLVEAFKATLEEVVQADLLIHVVDTASPYVDQQMAAVQSVLKEIGAQSKPMLLVFNKIDRPGIKEKALGLQLENPGSIAISALENIGLDALQDAIADFLRSRLTTLQLRLPPKEAKLIALLQASANIKESHYEDDCLVVEAGVPRHLVEQFRPFVIQ